MFFIDARLQIMEHLCAGCCSSAIIAPSCKYFRFFTLYSEQIYILNQIEDGVPTFPKDVFTLGARALTTGYRHIESVAFRYCGLLQVSKYHLAAEYKVSTLALSLCPSLWKTKGVCVHISVQRESCSVTVLGH